LNFERHLGCIDAALRRALDRWCSRIPGDVAAAVDHGVTSQGKRLRPVLCVSAFEACGGEIDDRAYDLAAAIEMIHAYSLMHDDLPSMDDAELRRGRTTTHIAHGEDVTMRAGAVLIPLASLQALAACRALGCEERRGRRVAQLLLEGAGPGGMVGGQWLDLLGEGRMLGARELDDLHRRKTGALVRASPVMGGVAAGASAEVEAALGEYGRALGLAFQIADDILDSTESAQTLGKNPSDVALAKSTYVSLYGLDEARRRAEGQVQQALAAVAGVGLADSELDSLAIFAIQRRN
jgi:geranylgeranyl pyrophosphate synthase